MRKKLVTLALAVFIALVTTVVIASGRPAEALKTARADVPVLPQADARTASQAAVTPHTFVDLRDSAALVLVGSMLIGLAAAVRRTA